MIMMIIILKLMLLLLVPTTIINYSTTIATINTDTQEYQYTDTRTLAHACKPTHETVYKHSRHEYSLACNLRASTDSSRQK